MANHAGHRSATAATATDTGVRGQVWHHGPVPIRLPVRLPAGCIPGSTPDRHDGDSGDPNRRTALRVAGGSVAGVFALSAATGCADEAPTEPDPLAAEEVLARADAKAARAAIATEPQRHGTLSTIATERTAHADALRTEIERAIGVYGDGTTPAHSTEAPATSPTPAGPPSVETLRTGLASARRSAAELAATQSEYRAGLLASISAACAVHAEVLLG